MKTLIRNKTQHYLFSIILSFHWYDNPHHFNWINIRKIEKILFLLHPLVLRPLSLIQPLSNRPLYFITFVTLRPPPLSLLITLHYLSPWASGITVISLYIWITRRNVHCSVVQILFIYYLDMGGGRHICVPPPLTNKKSIYFFKTCPSPQG